MPAGAINIHLELQRYKIMLEVGDHGCLRRDFAEIPVHAKERSREILMREGQFLPHPY